MKYNNSDEIHDSKSVEDLNQNIDQYQQKYTGTVANNIIHLGINKCNLVKQYLHQLSPKLPITQQVLAFSQSEIMMKEDELTVASNDTQIYLTKHMQLQNHTLNSQGALFVLREVLGQQGISSIIDDYTVQQRKEQLVHNRVEEQFFQIFSILDLHLLTTNLSTNCLAVKLDLTECGSFFAFLSDKAAQHNLRTMVTEEIYQLLSAHFKINDMFKVKTLYQIYLIKQQADLPHNHLVLNFYISPLRKLDESGLFSAVQSQLPLRISTVMTTRVEQVINLCRIDMKSMDLYLNRTYKTEDQEDRLEKVNGILQYKPKGWTHYPFLLPQFFVHSSQDLELVQYNWGYGYCDLMINSYQEDFSQIEDVGPNRHNFENKKCGNGFIIYSRADNPHSNRSTQILYQGTYYKFYIKLRVKFDTAKVRVPSGYNDQIYIINDPQDICSEGLVLKRVRDIPKAISIVSKSSMNV